MKPGWRDESEEADGGPCAVDVRRETQMQQCNSRCVAPGGRCFSPLLARRRLSQKLTMPRRSRPWLLKSPRLPQGNPSAPQLLVDPGLARLRCGTAHTLLAARKARTSSAVS